MIHIWDSYAQQQIRGITSYLTVVREDYLIHSVGLEIIF